MGSMVSHLHAPNKSVSYHFPKEHTFILYRPYIRINFILARGVNIPNVTVHSEVNIKLSLVFISSQNRPSHNHQEQQDRHRIQHTPP